MAPDPKTGKIVAIRVQMPDILRAQFKAQCALQDKTMNEMVITLIEQWLASSPEPGHPRDEPGA